MKEKHIEMFLSLSSVGKIYVLMRVAHWETIRAREAYLQWDGPIDGEFLRDSNERMHRLVGNSLSILGRHTILDNDAWIIRGAGETFAGRGCEELEQLTVWLREAAALYGARPPREDAKPYSVPSGESMTER